MLDPECYVKFMTLLSPVDEAVIPGVLSSYGVPHLAIERFVGRGGRYIEIQVPASHLDDARRALEDATNAGKQMSS